MVKRGKSSSYQVRRFSRPLHKNMKVFVLVAFLAIFAVFVLINSSPGQKRADTVMTQGEDAEFKSPIFSQPFIKDQHSVISGSIISLPSADFTVTDSIIVDGMEYDLNAETVSDIIVRKEVSDVQGSAKITYGFKNVKPQASSLRLAWKTQVPATYESLTINGKSYGLGQDFSVDGTERIDFFDNGVQRYFLSFLDVAQVFGSVSVTYVAAGRQLSWQSQPKSLLSGEELIVDPSGGVTNRVFFEPFTWQGDFGATIANGAANTVWWNAHHWDARTDTTHNAFTKMTCPASSNGGDHIDIHPAN